MKLFKRLSIVILTISSILLILSLEITGLLSPYAGNFYGFTTPFIFTTILNLILSIVFLYGRKIKVYFINMVVFTLLIIPAIYAISRWPGGDDGPGLAWLFAIVYGSCITLFLGGTFLILSFIKLSKEKNNK